MSSRVNWFFRQRVAENELDFAFDQLEQADRDLASDVGIYGIKSGVVPSPHQPVPDLRIDLTGPARAFDRLGRRLFVPVAQTVDCERDMNGLPTAVDTPGNVRWLTVYLRFARILSDPRTDGGGQQVFFRRDESFELVLRQGPEGANPSTLARPPLESDELLVCDVLRKSDQTEIVAGDLDVSRRQRFIFAEAESVGVLTGGWQRLVVDEANLQRVLNVIDSELHAHLSGLPGSLHRADDIQLSPTIGWITYNRLQDFLEQFVADLQFAGSSNPGASRIGAKSVAGTPNALEATSISAQLAALLGVINSHASVGSGGAHAASAISATSNSWLTSATVQLQLGEVVTDLAATGAGVSGTERIGVEAMAGTPTSLTAGTLRAALSALLTAMNSHATANSAAHAAGAVTVADANNRLAATTVEGALQEALKGFEGDHLRDNENNGGQHRTIRQPVLDTNVALLWDSRGTGQQNGRLRVIADSTGSIWITVNANLSGSTWTKDFIGGSSALKLNADSFSVMNHVPGTTALTFTDWLKEYQLGMQNEQNSTWNVRGAVIDHGRVGLEGCNPSNVQGTVVMATSVTFRVIYNATPSSITLTTISDSGAGQPTVSLIDRFGFHVRHSGTLASFSQRSWLGRYTVVV